MMYKIKLNVSFAPKLFNQEFHDRLVKAAQEIIKLRMAEQAHVHQDTVYLWSDYYDDHALNIGAIIQRNIKNSFQASVGPMDFESPSELKTFCSLSAMEQYEGFIDNMNSTANEDLFKGKHVIEFQKLPKFFTKGTSINES